MSFLDSAITCSVAIWVLGWIPSIFPLSTHPKTVSKAVGVPGDPVRRPWSSTSAKTSAPSRISILPGLPNPGSASFKPDKCFQRQITCDFRNDNCCDFCLSSSTDRRHFKTGYKLDWCPVLETSDSRRQWFSNLFGEDEEFELNAQRQRTHCPEVHALLVRSHWAKWSWSDMSSEEFMHSFFSFRRAILLSWFIALNIGQT